MRDQDTSPPDKKDVSAAALFRMFFSISAVTVGGGYAMVPVIGQAVEKKGWLDEKEFFDLFAKAQSFPGPLALTTALIVGSRLGGLAGAAASTAGVVIPPFGALIAVGALIGHFGELKPVKAFLEGAGATVPGLIAAMIYKLVKNRKWTLWRAGSVLVLALLLILVPRFTLPVFLAGIFLLYFAEKSWNS